MHPSSLRSLGCYKKKKLELILKGVNIDNEEFISGMVAIAVPITDDQGRYVASLAFHGPSQRLTVEKVISQKDVLFKGAQTMKDVLFY